MRDELATKRYVQVEQLIDPRLASVLYQSFILRHWRGEFDRDAQVPQAVTFPGDAVLDAMLLNLWGLVEELSGCRLLPTYAYARLYLNGNELKRHSDRPACEVSASILLGYDGGDPGLWFEPATKIGSDIGGGVIFLGQKAPHWRDRFDGTRLGQLFLHYVEENGPCAGHRFDRKPNRFPPSLIARRAAATETNSTA
jgi:hypothetical protein